MIHVPKAVAEAGLAAVRAAGADGLVAAGGGAAIGLAKIIARDLALPILAVPTTYSGSEATPIWGMSDGERKFTGKDARSCRAPSSTTRISPWPAASGERRQRHERHRPLRRGPMGARPHAVPDGACHRRHARASAEHLPRVVADGTDREARAECLIAAWLAGVVLCAGTGLQHKLAHVLGGLGLPHAETHAIILPHVTRFNLAAAPEAHARLAEALSGDPAERLADHAAGFADPADGWRRSGSIAPRSISSRTKSLPCRSARRERYRPTTCVPCSRPHSRTRHSAPVSSGTFSFVPASKKPNAGRGCWDLGSWQDSDGETHRVRRGNGNRSTQYW